MCDNKGVSFCFEWLLRNQLCKQPVPIDPDHPIFLPRFLGESGRGIGLHNYSFMGSAFSCIQKKADVIPVQSIEPVKEACRDFSIQIIL